jgi:hypothetical protein
MKVRVPVQFRVGFGLFVAVRWGAEA